LPPPKRPDDVKVLSTSMINESIESTVLTICSLANKEISAPEILVGTPEIEISLTNPKD
jgi:hypothetical protein